MPSLALVRPLLRELTTDESSERQTEPDLVMDDPAKVAAYTEAGEVDGVMAPVYLFHCRQICDVIRPGDIVVDLGCGPATQLAMVAALNPHSTFIGVDLSAEMLAKARRHIEAKGLTNVSFVVSDVTDLGHFADASVDVVMSKVALHPLPGPQHLQGALSEVARILKRGGGPYLVDFAHLKSDRSIDYFASQYRDRQPELFTLDYLYSLKAAFTLDDWKRCAAQCLADRAALRSTFLVPYMVALKSHSRRDPDPALTSQLSAAFARMPPTYQRDFRDLSVFFGLGGLSSRI
jgi:arsenite methyltransferase